MPDEDTFVLTKFAPVAAPDMGEDPSSRVGPPATSPSPKFDRYGGDDVLVDLFDVLLVSLLALILLLGDNPAAASSCTDDLLLPVSDIVDELLVLPTLVPSSVSSV